MKWIPREGKLPPKDTIILAFSPCYPEGNPMRFRILDSQFFCIATDATHYATLDAPAHNVDLAPLS
jgi:hypothetical protein